MNISLADLLRIKDEVVAGNTDIVVKVIDGIIEKERDKINTALSEPSPAKRFSIFGGQFYYARGGFNDLVGNADTLDIALIEVETLMGRRYESETPPYVEWWQIVDMTTGEIVKASPHTPHGGDDDHALPYNVRYENGVLVVIRPEESWDD